MYLGTTITSVLLIAACVLPIVISNRNRSKRMKLFFDKLNDFATQHSGQIDQHDVWNGTVIGIDKIKLKLFYIQTNGESQIEKEIDLKNVQQCNVVNKSRTVNNNGDSTKVIERLDLCFVFVGKVTPDILLPFYDINRDNLSIDLELELINKWATLINALLDEHLSKSQRHF
ncbi:MAG: hypothetical protein KF860_16415 [Cyclobacteriaceae bacterium]|nr:hypothetical protein [Cyclobacteriaceae bacterium]